MTTEKKKRGRPKNKSTKERERIEEMLRNPPPHIRNSKRKPLTFDHKQAEEIEKQMLKDHKSPPMPANIVYGIESAGPEFMTDDEIALTQAEYTRIKENIHQGQIAGGHKLTDNKNSRREKVFQKNPVLLQKLSSGIWTANRVANKFFDEWDAIQPHGRLLGEVHSARGDGLKKPTIRNLTRWLKVT